jgi:Helitron helicase-like domain at N-terminus
VLTVSHSASSKSIYNNPSLYPQAFPWLFPYGLGGIDTTTLSDRVHKHHLLMYHDKCFQYDLIFPFVTFSHQQLKVATSAGFLLADTSKFIDITSRLLSVNQDTLASISKQLSDSEIVKPLTDDERSCFQIVQNLNHINSRVQGSITSKKYMHSEIWSLIAYLGAPIWYITLSPADNKHPICLYFADDNKAFGH